LGIEWILAAAAAEHNSTSKSSPLFTNMTDFSTSSTVNFNNFLQLANLFPSDSQNVNHNINSINNYPNQELNQSKSDDLFSNWFRSALTQYSLFPNSQQPQQQGNEFQSNKKTKSDDKANSHLANDNFSF
jgi:hypothetical protein